MRLRCLVNVSTQATFVPLLSNQAQILTDVHCNLPFFRSFRIILTALFLFLNTRNGLKPTWEDIQ